MIQKNYDYTGVTLTKTVAITVNKANPSYTAPSNLTAIYGQTLKEVSLTSGFTWQDAADTKVGTVGRHEFLATFTPQDTNNYNTIQNIKLTITVSPATPANPATPTPAAVTYGGKLANIALTGGWKWSDGNTIPTADKSQYAAYYEVSDSTNYDWSKIAGYNAEKNRVERMISLTVKQAVPTVTLNTQNPQGVGENRSVDLKATVTGVTGGEIPSGSVEFFSDGNSIGTAVLSNGTTAFTWKQIPTGDHTVKAVFQGSVNYTAAQAETTYNLAKDTQQALVIAEIPAKTFGDAAFKLEVTGGSGTGALSYQVTEGDSVRVDQNGNVTIVKVGQSTITVTKATDQNYNATAETVVITVNPAAPVIVKAPTADSIRWHSMLATATLSGSVVNDVNGQLLEGNWAWENNREMPASGTYEETAVFTPKDSNYAPIEVKVSVTVYTPSSDRTESITWYTVTFDAQGGSAVDSASVMRTAKVAKPSNPTKEGYTFGGWFTDKECTDAYDFRTQVTQNMTLYAKWSEKTEQPTDPQKWNNPFIDVDENDWFYDNVKNAYIEGLMQGTTNTTFDPNGEITRGMFVTVLYRMEQEPGTNGSPFIDVADDAYYAKAVAWGYANGIINGISETEYAPDQIITREQMAAIIYRYAIFKGEGPVGDWAIRLDYSDLESVSDYAVEAVMFCTMKQFMVGDSETTFAPQRSATRAEAATLFLRILNALKKQL